MKKVLLVLFAVALAASMCFADEASGPSSGTTTFTGKVDFVSSGNSMSRENSQITVEGDNGETIVFTVTNDATIIGKDGKPTALDWVDQNDRVKIEYITNQDGITKTVKSITVLAD